LQRALDRLGAILPVESDLSKQTGYLARKGFMAELPASALSQPRGRACVNSVRCTRTLAFL
jgi:hypothetical protein